MLDWLKRRLSPVKKDAPRWQQLAESLQTFWTEQFDPSVDELAGMRSIHTTTAAGQKRIAAELGYYFEDGIPEGNIPVSIALRRMELYQKETDVPLVRALARIGLKGEWLPLYAPRAVKYGTVFYAESELGDHGLHLDAVMNTLGGTWGLNDDPPKQLTSDGVYLTSRAKMVVDLSDALSAEILDLARYRIQQIKPLHIVFDGFYYHVVMEISARPGIYFSFTDNKEIVQNYPWPTLKVNGLWKLGNDNVVSNHFLDGSWTIDGSVTLGEYLIPDEDAEHLCQKIVEGWMTMKKAIERPSNYVAARLGESQLKVDGEWKVGVNGITTLVEIRRIVD